MSFQFDIATPANPHTVADLIRTDLQAWRDSAIPPALRDRGLVRVVGTVTFDRFRIRTAPYRRTYATLGVRGQIRNDGHGGSIVHASVGIHRAGVATALVVVPMVAWIAWAETVWVSIAAVTVIAGASLVANYRVTRQNPEAAFLEDRLRRTLAPVATEAK